MARLLISRNKTVAAADSTGSHDSKHTVIVATISGLRAEVTDKKTAPPTRGQTQLCFAETLSGSVGQRNLSDGSSQSATRHTLLNGREYLAGKLSE